MAIVKRSVKVNASSQETMALLSDARRWPEWYPGMTDLNLTAPFPEAGGKVAFKAKSGGIAVPITETVLEYQSDSCRFFRWRAGGQGALAGAPA